MTLLLFLLSLQLFYTTPAIVTSFVTREGTCTSCTSSRVSSLAAPGFAACGSFFFCKATKGDMTAVVVHLHFDGDRRGLNVVVVTSISALAAAMTATVATAAGSCGGGGGGGSPCKSGCELSSSLRRW
jgi:hypothetical protein